VVKVWVIKKKSSYKHLSNSEWLTRYSCLNLQTKRTIENCSKDREIAYC